MTTPRSGRRLRRAPMIVAAAVLVVTATAIALVEVPTSRARQTALPPSSRSTRGSLEGIALDRPFAFARDMSLSQAQATVGFDIPRPDDQLASDDQITHVWVDASSGESQIQIDYSSGLYVELDHARQGLLGTDGQVAFFKEQVAEDSAQTNGQAQLVTVKGLPALLVPEDSAVFANGQSQGAGGDVEFVLEDEVLDVVGHFSDSDLLRAATTVTARPA